MKFREIPKGTRAVRPVRLRLANAPAVDGPDWEENDENTVTVGVRVLSGTEISAAIAKAQESVAKEGVPQWLATHPLCRLHEMAQTVAIGCVDIEARDEPFFVGGFAEVMGPELGGANIAYLFEQIETWNDEVTGRSQKFTGPEIIAAIVREAERPEHAQETFFSRLSPASRVSFFHSTAVMLTDLLTSRLLTGSQDDTSTTSSPATEAPAAPPAAPAPKSTKRRGKK